MERILQCHYVVFGHREGFLDSMRALPMQQTNIDIMCGNNNHM